MSFDIDPKDVRKRILCHHAESDCIFEVWSQNEFEQMSNGELLDDVTGIEVFEEMFRAQQKE